MLKDERCWGGAGHLAWALSKRSGDDLTGDPMYDLNPNPNPSPNSNPNLTGDPMYDACMAGVAPLKSDAFEWPGQVSPNPSSNPNPNPSPDPNPYPDPNPDQAPHLEPHLTKTCGFATGLEFRESAFQLNLKSEQVFRIAAAATLDPNPDTNSNP